MHVYTIACIGMTLFVGVSVCFFAGMFGRVGSVKASLNAVKAIVVIGLVAVCAIVVEDGYVVAELQRAICLGEGC